MLQICRQWLPRNKLEPLGVDSGIDKAKLCENKKPNVRKAVKLAYDKAISHRCRVTGEPMPASEETPMEESTNEGSPQHSNSWTNWYLPRNAVVHICK